MSDLEARKPVSEHELVRDGRIGNSLGCSACGTDLRGHLPSERCPHCRRSIRRTLRAWELSQDPIRRSIARQSVGVLRFSVLLMIPGVVFAIVCLVTGIDQHDLAYPTTPVEETLARIRAWRVPACCLVMIGIPYCATLVYRAALLQDRPAFFAALAAALVLASIILLDAPPG